MQKLSKKTLLLVAGSFVALTVVLVLAVLLLTRSSSGNNFFGGRYSLTLPTSWQATQISDDDSTIAFTLPESSMAGDNEGFIITVSDLITDKVSIQAYGNAFVGELKKANSTVSITDTKEGTLAGQSAVKVAYNFTDESGDYKSVTYSFFYKGEVYTVTYSTKAANFDKYYADFEKSIESMNLV